MEIEISFDGGKKVNASVNGHLVKTDQPVKAGGEGSAPSPFDLFLASLGTCAGIYVKMFCDQRGIPTDNIRLIQHLEYNPEAKLYTKADIEILVPADFPEKYIQALISTAELCTVKRHLQQPPSMVVSVNTVK